MKVYFVEVRHHFLADDGVGKFGRRFAEEPDVVLMTEVPFVNSGGRNDFRVRALAQQFTATVRCSLF